VDALAVTHLDAVRPEMRICTSYEVDGVPWHRIVPGPFRDLGYQVALTALLERARPGEMVRPGDWAAEIGELLGAPVALTSFGPTTADKRLGAPAAFASSGPAPRPSASLPPARRAPANVLAR
jgi:adenylosuccinate synthase